MVDGALGVLFQLLSAVDLPYNRTPSLHISVWSFCGCCSRNARRDGCATRYTHGLY